MELAKEAPSVRRFAVTAVVWPPRQDGSLNTLMPVEKDLEVIATNEDFFVQPGVLEDEVARIRARGTERFTSRPEVVSLGPEPRIKFQKPRTINLGRIGVLHTGGWQTLRDWPFEAEGQGSHATYQ